MFRVSGSLGVPQPQGDATPLEGARAVPAVGQVPQRAGVAGQKSLQRCRNPSGTPQ